MAPQIASKRALAALCPALFAVLLVSQPARAVEPNDVQRAEASFEAGRALMQQRKFAEACAKFAESQALDPGGGTILNLGICRRREGRTGTAFKVLTEALAQARADGRSDRIATAEKELAELTPDLSRLKVQLSPGAPAPEITIELDGERLAPSSVGEALPLDPGAHQLRASQPGHEPWATQITLAAVAGEQTITVPPLSPNAPAPPIALTPLVALPAPEAPRPRPVDEPVEKSSKRVLGFTLVSVGGAALVAGGIFGVRALSLKASSNQYWDGTHCTKSSCVDDWNDAKTSAHLSTIGLGIGVAALAVGSYFLLRPSSTTHSAVALSLGVSGSEAHAAAIGQF